MPSSVDLLTEYAPVALALLDRDMRYLAVTKRWLSDYGLDRQHLIGRSHYEIFPDIPDRMKETYRRALAGEAVQADVNRFHHPDGSTRWVRWDLCPWKDRSGRIGGVVVKTEDVTELKRVEESLQQERDLNQAIINTAQIAILLLDVDGHVMQFNPYFEQLTGWRLDEVRGRNWFDTFLPEDHHQAVREVFHRAIGGEPTRGNVNPIRTKAGERRDMEWYDERLLDPTGRLIGLLSVGQDVTERVRAGETLKASEERQRAVLASVSTQIAVVDRSGQIVTVNPAWEEFTRANGGDPVKCGVGANYLAVCRTVTGEDAQQAHRVMAGLQAVLDGKVTEFVTEYPCHTPALSRWFLLQIVPLRVPEGGAVVSHLDITSRVLAEQQMHEREARLAAVLDAAIDAVISIDDTGLIREVNAATSRLFGYTAEELVGQNVAVLMPHPYRGEHDGYIARYLQTGEKRIIGSGREVTARRKDGTTFPIELSVQETVGPIRRFVGFVRDLTARKELEALFLRAQRLESIGTLASGIAHDLNNVLTPVLVAVKLLLRDRPGIDRKALLETAQASIERGAGMIRQLLTFGGGMTGERVPVAVGELIQEVRGMLEHTFSKSIALTVSVADELWTAIGDPIQLTQVLVNLCVNARDAMPAGGVLSIRAENHTLTTEGAARLPGTRPGRYVQLTVSDTGTGMTPEVQARIFDPFFTTKSFGQGTGLGLSTTQGIVKSHNGFIGVYSQPGEGTRFSVYLPAADSPKNGTVVATMPADESGGGRLILVVDDEPAVLVAAQATLETAGYRVATAVGGEAALDWYARHRREVAAVVLDMMMPGLDGPAVIARLRALDPSVVILTVSGLPSTVGDTSVVSGGRSAFLSKPYSDNELLDKLSALIGSEGS